MAMALCLSLAISPGAWAADGDGKLYTAYNIWIEQPEKVWSTNFKKGWILPAGSAVRDVVKNKKLFRFVVEESGDEITIVFVPKHHPGMTGADIHDRLITTKDLATLTAGFTEAEREAIETGSYEVGMSKAAILVSLGPAPEVETPSTDANVWKYWAHRFNTFDLKFDSDGKVEEIID